MNIDSAFYHNRLAVSKAQKVQPNQHTKQHTEIHWDGQLKKKTSPFPEGAKSVQLTFEWFSGKKVSAYYSEYFSFVDEMKGVSSEKKEALKNLIRAC